MGLFMKKTYAACFLLILLCTPCGARDFVVEFVEENYKETKVQFSYDPLIYHSIQVNSSAGPKLLVLTGEDYHYRKWLRHYIAENKKFIAKISDERTDEFVSSKAYMTDVTSLHPFNGDKWEGLTLKRAEQNTLPGDNYILIVDSNQKRTQLIQAIISKMGFDATIFKSGKQALDFFNSQPEKFKLIMTHHSISGMPLVNFIETVLILDDKIPVMIDTGYKNQNIEDKFTAKFSKFKSIHIAPVILKDLQKTIEMLTKKNA